MSRRGGELNELIENDAKVADSIAVKVYPESAQKKLPSRKTEKTIFITLEFVANLLKWQKIVKIIVKI